MSEFSAEEEPVWADAGGDSVEDAEVVSEEVVEVAEEGEVSEEESTETEVDGVQGENADEAAPEGEEEPQEHTQESRSTTRIRSQAATIQELRAQVRQFEDSQSQANAQQAQGEFPKNYQWTNEDVERAIDTGLTPEQVFESQRQSTQPSAEQQQANEVNYQAGAARDHIFDAASTAPSLPNDWRQAVESAKFFPNEVVIGVSQHTDPVGAAYAISKDFHFQSKLAGMSPRQQYIESSSYEFNNTPVAPSQKQPSKAPDPLKTVTSKQAPTSKSKFEMSYQELEAAEAAKGYDPFS